MRWVIALLLSLFGSFARAGVEYKDVTLSDGSKIQTCARFPDPQKFPGKRPLLMLIMGSGNADTCRRRKEGESGLIDGIVERGVAIMLRQKRGLRHDPITDRFSIDLHQYRQADLPHLKTDTLAALEEFLRDPRVDAKNVGVWGGSEGTFLATYLGLRHPELREVVLVSSAIEPFPDLYARQMYEMLPAELIEMFDRNKDGSLSSDEIGDQFLRDNGLHAFGGIDSNRDGRIDREEISAEVKRVIAISLANDVDTFFLSDLGGTVTANWVRSSLLERDLGSEVLRLQVPTFLHHGTADEHTLVQPVYDLEARARQIKGDFFRFQYYPGLKHELTSDVLNQIFQQAVDVLLTSPESKSEATTSRFHP